MRNSHGTLPVPDILAKLRSSVSRKRSTFNSRFEVIILKRGLNLTSANARAAPAEVHF
jgi:hypothetical protein